MAPKAVYVPNGKDYGVKGSGSDKTPKKKGNSKTPLIVCGVIAGIYLVGAITFSQVYMPGTKIAVVEGSEENRKITFSGDL